MRQVMALHSVSEWTEKLSPQAWNITPKIKLVDRLLCENEEFKTKALKAIQNYCFNN